MNHKIEIIPDGSVTSPKGFQSAGVAAGIKSTGKLDLGLLVSETRCSAAAVFTRNVIKGASLLVSREHLRDGYAQCVVANSGNANACTGERGMLDAREMARIVAQCLKISEGDVLPASTGIIGEYLPLPAIRKGIEQAAEALSPDGGIRFAQAIMTTDTVPKHAARRVSRGETSFSLGGVAKGAGMIHPNMATMLVFLTTDLKVETAILKPLLLEAVDHTFNRFTIDGDTSCDDTVVLLANGRANAPEINDTAGPAYSALRDALFDLCSELTYRLAGDGEGVTKVVTIQVQGARTREEAARVARSIAISPLVKTAFHGEDPNWGRIVTAAGNSGVEFDPAAIDLKIGNHLVVDQGERGVYREEDVHGVMKNNQFEIVLTLNQGKEQDFYITTDFSKVYVDINADYRHRS